MYFPWVGLFEQIILADILVFYDDVQFSKGSFTNRVQIKTQSGIKWLTVPLSNLKLGQNINETKIKNNKSWQASQIDFLKNTYKDHKYLADVLTIVNNVLSSKSDNISQLSELSILEVLDYFGIKKIIYQSSNLNIFSSSSERVLNIAQHFSCNKYITGHGARSYLDHELFEKNNIEVRYINYAKVKYEQKFGDFIPYVSILDLIANEGKDSIKYFKSKTISWKEFINE